jgi:heptaprenyl diphosphate synthase
VTSHAPSTGRRPGTLSPGLVAVDVRVRAGLERVERVLEEATATADPFIREAATVLLAGGKRFRATCVLLAGHFGVPDARGLAPIAAAIELTHLASMYHDDVIDEAEMRRGSPTANARYDNLIAILTGDYLFARASEITAELGEDASRTLARTFTRLCVGQISEARGPQDGEDPVAHYMDVLEGKTGALIGAACQLGAKLAGAKPDRVEALAEFGQRVGVAFQLGDDLLDITATAARAGKRPGTDLRQGVRTLPVLYLLRAGGPDAETVKRVLDGQTDDESVEHALDVLRRSEALREARATARGVVDEALTSLGRLPDIPAREAFQELAHQALERDH